MFSRRQRCTERLTRTEKVARLKQRIADPQWRHYGYTLMLGKTVALAILVAVFAIYSFLTGGSASADPAPHAANAVVVSAINTAWVLVAAYLVFGMQVGFTMLEAGFCRSRETVNVLMECVVDTCLCGLLFWAWGYAFMFSTGNGFIGLHWFFLNHAPATYSYTVAGSTTDTSVAFLAHWIFQFAFADTCSTVCSGAMIGRTGFVGDLLYSVGVSGFIYPIVGHWAWGPDGFLALMGSTGYFLPHLGQSFHDFAGSTVVHTIGGTIALAGSLVLGPRIGRKFKRDGGGPMLPHDLVIACSGGLILWFGWYGFNPGSTLSAIDFGGIGRVSANTTLAACSGGLMAMIYAFPQTKKWDLGFTVNGFLAGLVAITCPCYWVTPTGAVILGAVAGVVVVMGVNLLEYLRIDDPIGAVPVHCFAGIWGTWSLGLFASGQFSGSGAYGMSGTALKGLFYGGGWTLLEAQIIGNAIITISTFVAAFALMFAVHKMGLLRVSKAGEEEGLDIHEHGIPAYPEYALVPGAMPGAMSPSAFSQSGASEAHAAPLG